MMRVPFFRAGSAWACVTQPLEAEMGLVAVIPLNIHPGAGGDVDLDRFRVNHAHQSQYRIRFWGAIWVPITGSPDWPFLPGWGEITRCPDHGDHRMTRSLQPSAYTLSQLPSPTWHSTPFHPTHTPRHPTSPRLGLPLPCCFHPTSTGAG